MRAEPADEVAPQRRLAAEQVGAAGNVEDQSVGRL